MTAAGSLVAGLFTFGIGGAVVAIAGGVKALLALGVAAAFYANSNHDIVKILGDSFDRKLNPQLFVIRAVPEPTLSPVLPGEPIAIPPVEPTPEPTATPTVGLQPVVSGFAIVFANYVSTDTLCATTPTSALLYPLGTCLKSPGTAAAGYILSGNGAGAGLDIYSTYYASADCSGGPKSTSKLTTMACVVGAYSVQSNWLYLSQLTALVGAYSVYTSFADSSCAGSAQSVDLYAVTPASSACTPKSCAPIGSSYVTVDCLGSAPTASPTAGKIATGYVYWADHAVSDSTCSQSSSAGAAYKLGTCSPITYTPTATEPQRTVGTMFTSDTAGNVYRSIYASASCSGAPMGTDKVSSLNQCSCSASSCVVASYYGSLPAISTAYSMRTVYTGAACDALSDYSYFLSFGAATCTPGACTSVDGGMSSKLDCVGYATAAVAAGTVTTGYATLSASFASTDSSCKTPSSSVVRPLNVCIPNSDSQAYKLTANSDGSLFTSFYSNLACSGAITTTVPYTKQPCACTTTGCALSGVYAGTALPSTKQGVFVTTQTQYAGSTCTGTPVMYTYSVGNAACAPTACAPSIVGGVTLANSVSCATSAAPVAAPTSPVVVFAKQTLGGVAPAAFLASTDMQAAFKSTIANAAGVSVSAVNILSASRRRALDASIAYSVVSSDALTTSDKLSAALTSAATQSALTASMVSRHTPTPAPTHPHPHTHSHTHQATPPLSFLDTDAPPRSTSDPSIEIYLCLTFSLVVSCPLPPVPHITPVHIRRHLGDGYRDCQSGPHPRPCCCCCCSPRCWRFWGSLLRRQRAGDLGVGRCQGHGRGESGRPCVVGQRQGRGGLLGRR